MATATGEERGSIEEALEEASTGAASPRVAAGLAKLLLDRATFQEPGPEAAQLRETAFDAGAAALRGLEPDAAPSRLDEALQAHLSDLPLETAREQLYADLPEARALLAWEPLTAPELLERWNLALVQGLVLRASRLSLRLVRPELRRLRRLFRWMRFCRLVADVARDGDDWLLTVEGPAELLQMQKKYGLQLAQFVAVLPHMERWSLSASLTFRAGAPPALLELDHTAPLVPPHGRSLGWIPEEIGVVARKLAEEPGRWRLDLSPAPRRVGTGGWCVPDMHFVRDDGGAELFVEFFHRWHRHQLARRLDELATRPDPQLVLGVDEALIGSRETDPDLAARLMQHPQVMRFKGFPSERRLRALLRAHES